MRVIICDRCGEKIPDGTKIGYVSANWREGYEGDLIMPNTYEKWDLCEDCMKKIALLIDGTIDVQLEPEALPAEAYAPVEALTEAMEKEMQEPEAADSEDEEDEEDDGEDEDTEDPEEAETIRRIAGTPPNAKPVNLRELRELVKQGKTAKEIADHFGISVATYYKHRKKAERLYITGNL